MTTDESTATGDTRRDRRAVSTVVGYVLILGIVTILVSGLLIGVGGFVENQQRTTIRNELEVVGEQVASDIASSGRLVRSGSTYPGEEPSTVEVDRDLPTTVAGKSYVITLRPSPPNAEIELETENPDVTVTITMYIQTDITLTTVSGGSISIVYDTTADEIEVQQG